MAGILPDGTRWLKENEVLETVAPCEIVVGNTILPELVTRSRITNVVAVHKIAKCDGCVTTLQVETLPLGTVETVSVLRRSKAGRCVLANFPNT